MSMKALRGSSQSCRSTQEIRSSTQLVRQQPDSGTRGHPWHPRLGALPSRVPMAHPLQTGALLCFLALVLASLQPTAGSAGGAWDTGHTGAGAEVQVWAHQLVANNFTESLSAASEPWALVEFFASWYVLLICLLLPLDLGALAKLFKNWWKCLMCGLLLPAPQPQESLCRPLASHSPVLLGPLGPIRKWQEMRKQGNEETSCLTCEAFSLPLCFLCGVPFRCPACMHFKVRSESGNVHQPIGLGAFPNCLTKCYGTTLRKHCKS